MEMLRACCLLATCGALFAAVQNFALDPTYLNHRLTGFLDSTAEDLSLAGCGQKCRRTPTCQSINYEHATRSCELNIVHIAPSDNAGWVYSYVEDWPQDIVGNCGSNPCPSNELCVPSDSGPLCFPGCGAAPVFVNIDSLYIPTNPTLGSVATYVCTGGRTQNDTTSDMTLTCLGSGLWSRVDFDCV